MTEPNPGSEAEGPTPAIESGLLLPEGKDDVTDAGEKENELRKSEEDKGEGVTMEVEENNDNGENSNAVERGNELIDEKQAKEGDTVDAEDVKMVGANNVEVDEAAATLDPEGGKTQDRQDVKVDVSEDAKEESAKDLKNDFAQDVKAGTTEDGKAAKSVNLSEGDLKDLEAEDVESAEPMDSDDAKLVNADDEKLLNAESVQKDVLKDENSSKDEKKEKREVKEDKNMNEKSDSGSTVKKGDQDQADGSKKKRSKATPKGNQKEKKDNTEKDKEFLSTPATSTERPVRERKTVERLVDVISKEPVREFRVEKGRGTPLKNIPNVAYRLARKKPADIKLIHQILFGRGGKAVDFKSHILQFSGILWQEGDEKQRAKMKEKLDKHVKGTLLNLCDLFDLPVSKANSRKEDLVTKLLDFLVAPQAMTDIILSEKDQGKSRKRKRAAKENSSKSLGSLSGKGAKKKRNKSVDTPSGKWNGSDTSEDEDDEDNNNFGTSDEEKSAKHSESEINESEPEESEKDVTDDEENFAEDKPDKNIVPKGSDLIGKTKLKVGISSKKTPIGVDKSPKSSLIISSKSKGKSDNGAKVLSRKTKNVDSQKKKPTPTSDSRGKDASKKVGKRKAKLVEVEHPTEDELRSKICEILEEVDFNTATFTDILRRLAAHYKTDLTPRKASLKLMIQEELTRLAGMSDENDEN